MEDYSGDSGQKAIADSTAKTLHAEGDALIEGDVIVELDTSNLIIGITEVFNSGRGYEATIMGVLEMLSKILNPDRLLVFERGEHTTKCTFEWVAEGIASNIGFMQSLPNEQFDTMGKVARSQGSPVLVSEVDELESVDHAMAKRFAQRGVSRMMAVPMFNDGTIIGYLSANNYRLDADVDVKRVLDTVAPFVSTRIVNQRLVTRLERLGTHDSLTGLLNRRGIDLAIAQRLAGEPGKMFALAIIDIDDFKIVNDLHGHDVGDAALKALANAIVQAFPSDAIVGRNGGDEFFAMRIGEDADSIGAPLAAIANGNLGFEYGGSSYEVSISAGYVLYPQQAGSLQDAYAKADAALYAVKLAGKSGCRQYSTEYDYQYRSQLGFTPRDIADNIPCAVAVYKATSIGEILFANDELAELLECDGYADLIAFTGGAFEGVVHPDDRDRVLRGPVKADFELESKLYTDYRVMTKQGKVKYIADCSRHVRVDKIGEVVYVLLVDKEERKARQS